MCLTPTAETRSLTNNGRRIIVISLDLSQELEHRIQEQATRQGLDAESYLSRLIEVPEPEKLQAQEIPEKPMTKGAKLLAKWEAEGVLGIWQDRPDTLELAEEFRQNFERKFHI